MAFKEKESWRLGEQRKGSFLERDGSWKGFLGAESAQVAEVWPDPDGAI